MEISSSTYYSLGPNGHSVLPRSLRSIKPNHLLAAIGHYPQGNVHRRVIAQMLHNVPIEAEILQQNSDFAILRVCPGRFRNVGHYIIGYADEHGLFIHNVPSGDIDLCSEPMWYILQWLNRSEERFHRVQGDLLLRKIKDPWEIEQIELKESEEPHYFGEYDYHRRIGNGHDFQGVISQISNSDSGRDPRIVAKVGGKRKRQRLHSEQVRVNHSEHREVSRESKKKEYHEGAMQRRGEDGDSGGDD